MSIKKLVVLSMLIACVSVFSGCSKQERTLTGALIGAGAGALVGSAAGGTGGGVAGAAIGGITGAVIGNASGDNKK